MLFVEHVEHFDVDCIAAEGTRALRYATRSEAECVVLVGAVAFGRLSASLLMKASMLEHLH
jgi:hypothetical protein